MLCLWEGVPFTMIGMTNVLGMQLCAVATLAGVVVFFFRVFRGTLRFTKWDGLALFLFASFVFSSVAWSMFIKPQPLAAWAIASYTVSPILMVMTFRAFGCRLGDAVQALYWTGFLASLLLFCTIALNLHFLDFYIRGSAFGSEVRIVFFKLEAAFGLVIAMMKMLKAERPRDFIGPVLVVIVISYNVFAASESRLAIFAVMAALGLAWLFILKGNRKFLLALVAPFVAVPVIWYVVGRYLANFTRLDDYLARDVSASWRKITIEHYRVIFDQSHGLGFGFMSANARYDNPVSFAFNRASELYGVPGYVVSLDDIGLYAAQFQFGYVGIAAVVIMTFMAIFSLFRVKDLGPSFAPVAVVGLLMGTFLISPIPMNYFTLLYTAHVGGVLWFLASEADAARKSWVARQKQKLGS